MMICTTTVAQKKLVTPPYLKKGDTILGNVRPPKEGEKYFPLIQVNKINGLDPKIVRDRVSFEHLTPL